MQKRTVRETFWITHSDYPDWRWPVTVDVAYSLLDDGECTVEILHKTLDYPTQGSA